MFRTKVVETTVCATVVCTYILPHAHFSLLPLLQLIQTISKCGHTTFGSIGMKMKKVSAMSAVPHDHFLLTSSWLTAGRNQMSVWPCRVSHQHRMWCTTTQHGRRISFGRRGPEISQFPDVVIAGARVYNSLAR